MRTLRKEVIGEFNGLIQDLVDTIKESEEQGDGLDLTTLFSQQSTRYKNLLEAFEKFEDRTLGEAPQKKKRGGIFS